MNGRLEISVVATRPVVTIARCRVGSETPEASSEATARLATLPVSPRSSGLYHRDTVKIPSSVRRSRKIFHASTVYSAFSDSVNAPAPVAAHVSMSDIWMTEYDASVREM